MKKSFSFSLVFLFSLTALAQDTTRLSLLFLGDIMQHDSQIADAYDENSGAYDYGPCFQYIKPYIAEADLAIGNLEVTLWLLAVTITSIPMSCSAVSNSSGALNCGYPLYGFPASVTLRLPIARSASAIYGLIY